MQRQIKFRAKGRYTGEWVSGSLLHYNLDYISPLDNSTTTFELCYIWLENTEEGGRRVEVDKNTIGQFTGLYDCHGKEIYEGDILRFGNSPSGVCEVKWNETLAAFCIRFYFEDKIGSRPLGEWVECEKNIAIIGNIHDNPELLEGGEK